MPVPASTSRCDPPFPARPALTQAIVISLKDVFFDKADALLGVTKNLEQQSSRVLTFDLSAFLDA